MNPYAPAPKPGMSSSTKVVLAILGAFLALMVVGCLGCAAVMSTSAKSGKTNSDVGTRPQPIGPTQSETRASTPEQRGPVTIAGGQTAAVKAGYTGQADAKVTVSAAGVFKSGNQFDKPEKGQFYSIRVVVEVIRTDSSYQPGSEDFKLVAADGNVYNAEFFSTAGDALDATEIRAGQKKTGRVFFDTPVGAEKGAKVQFEGDGEPVAYWTL